MAQNAVLRPGMTESAMQVARAQSEAPFGETAHVYTDTRYAAGTPRGTTSAGS